MAVTLDCAVGEWSNPVALVCSKCKVKWYCNRACRLGHPGKHCFAHNPMLPGTYDFLGLPHEIRDKVALIKHLHLFGIAVSSRFP